MHYKLLKISSLALVAPFVAGCATKGWTRDLVNSRLVAERATTDSAIANERAARMAGDSSSMAAVATLRADLDSMRTEFNTKITALNEGVKFDMPVNFAFDDATITDEAKPALDRFAKVVQKHYTGAMITIEGFADPAGSQRYNAALSQRRAEAVKAYLATQGLTAEELRSIGYGEARQVVKGAERDMPGAEQNRRVTFVIETKGNAAATGVASTSSQ